MEAIQLMQCIIMEKHSNQINTPILYIETSLMFGSLHFRFDLSFQDVYANDFYDFIANSDFFLHFMPSWVCPFSVIGIKLYLPRALPP